MQDTFSYKTKFEYSWLLNHKKLLNTSSSSKHHYKFDKPQDVFIGANVTAKLYSHGKLYKEKQGMEDFRRFLTIIGTVYVLMN